MRRDASDDPRLSGEWPAARCRNGCGYNGLMLAGVCPRCRTYNPAAVVHEREGIEGLPDVDGDYRCPCWLHRASWRVVALMAGITLMILALATVMAIYGGGH